jgi:hypothetical protein
MEEFTEEEEFESSFDIEKCFTKVKGLVSLVKEGTDTAAITRLLCPPRQIARRTLQLFNIFF